MLYNYFGDYYKTQKDYTTATKYYTTALSMYEEMQSKFGASVALYNLGQLNADLKNYDKAIALTTKSLDYSKAIGISDQPPLDCASIIPPFRYISSSPQI